MDLLDKRTTDDRSKKNKPSFQEKAVKLMKNQGEIVMGLEEKMISSVWGP